MLTVESSSLTVAFEVRCTDAVTNKPVMAIEANLTDAAARARWSVKRLGNLTVVSAWDRPTFDIAAPVPRVSVSVTDPLLRSRFVDPDQTFDLVNRRTDVTFDIAAARLTLDLVDADGDPLTGKIVRATNRAGAAVVLSELANRLGSYRAEARWAATAIVTVGGNALLQPLQFDPFTFDLRLSATGA